MTMTKEWQIVIPARLPSFIHVVVISNPVTF
jgi:hypothetical protein